jgi:hypothetical protein
VCIHSFWFYYVTFGTAAGGVLAVKRVQFEDKGVVVQCFENS